MKTMRIIIQDGPDRIINQPPGLDVEVYDYDIRDVETMRLLRDEDGNWCVQHLFESEGEEPGEEPPLTSDQRGNIADLLSDLGTRVSDSLHDIPALGIHIEERMSLTAKLGRIQAAQKLMRPVAEQEG